VLAFALLDYLLVLLPQLTMDGICLSNMTEAWNALLVGGIAEVQKLYAFLFPYIFFTVGLSSKRTVIK